MHASAAFALTRAAGVEAAAAGVEAAVEAAVGMESAMVVAGSRLCRAIVSASRKPAKTALEQTGFKRKGVTAWLAACCLRCIIADSAAMNPPPNREVAVFS